MISKKFVVLTGIDGSGKDYVAQHLHKFDPHSSLMSTPTPPFLPSRSEIDSFALSIPATHYFFYLASIIHASEIIKQKLDYGNVYCGRYLIDTVVYHRAMGLLVELEYETHLYKIKRPDTTIFLEIDDEQVRQERLNKRGKFTIGDKLVNDEQLRNAIKKEYESLSNNYIKVDNCGRNIQDVVTEIQELIGFA
ncbi:hypothetical protein ACFLZW_05330 [Chloroflexota bacterium]